MEKTSELTSLVCCELSLEREAKRKGFVPGSGQYQDVNQTKVYKKMNQTFSF